jgi:16S rRNA (adenine1518-N6/adenine1519-N6)-dimethyltransferase
MTLKDNLKNLLEKYKIKPNKRLGQNFLIDENVLKKIIAAAEISPQETILDIGPGLGALTQELVKKAKKVIAVEKDKKMAGILKQTFKDCANLEIIQGDILKIAPPTAPKIVANIPYYLTSPLIRLFLESKNPPREMILTLQKEVGQRICAKPGQMSLLSVSVQIYSQPKIVGYISKKSFWPMPKVDSAIVKIIPYRQRDCFARQRRARNDRALFFKIVKAGFASPRKQLANNLADKLGIEKEEIKRALIECGFNIQTRAQNLSVEDWERLIKELSLLHKPETGQGQ